MTKYEYLLCRQETGELSILLQLGLPTQLPKWMEIYAYHLTHPSLSHVQLAADLKTSKSTVQRALAFMNQLLM
jgi:hypothetical protein